MSNDRVKELFQQGAPMWPEGMCEDRQARRIIVLPPKDEVERLRYDTTTNLLNKINEQDTEIATLKVDNERLKAKLASLGQVGLPGW